MLAKRKATAAIVTAPIHKPGNSSNGLWLVGVGRKRRANVDAAPLKAKVSPIAVDRTAITQLVETDFSDKADKADTGK